MNRINLKIAFRLWNTCLSFLIFLLITNAALSVPSPNRYAVSNIPKNLLLHANAVIRANEYIYTIEKNGIKKMIYQTPWYENGEYMGFTELSLVIPMEMKHFKRNP